MVSVRGVAGGAGQVSGEAACIVSIRRRGSVTIPGNKPSATLFVERGRRLSRWRSEPRENDFDGCDGDLDALIGSLSAVHRSIISSNGPSVAANDSLPGVSLTTPVGGPWDSITFNFFDTNGDPEANGNLYILTSQYLGTPNGLSTLTPGFLAQSIGTVANVRLRRPFP